MRSGRVLIVGVGSSFGADQLGWKALALLRQGALARRFTALDIEFAQCDRPGSGLLHLMQEHCAVIVIDAMQSADAAGTIRRFVPEQLSTETGLLSTHGFGVADALALGRALGHLPRQLIVYGIATGNDMTLTQLTPDTLGQLEESIGHDLTCWADESVICV